MNEQLYFNGYPIGEIISYEQQRYDDIRGWSYFMKGGRTIFVDFKDIKRISNWVYPDTIIDNIVMDPETCKKYMNWYYDGPHAAGY